MSFTIFQNEKTPFQTIKTRSSKSRKIDIFPKALTHCFCQKMAIFPTFFIGNIGQENVFYDILERKNAFLSFKNKKFKKSKIDIFSSWFLSKIRQNRVRRCISRYARKKKRSFQIIKTRSQKFSQSGQLKTRRSRSPKTGIFHRDQSMVLAKKWEFFEVFILGKIGQEDVYYDILEGKNTFVE